MSGLPRSTQRRLAKLAFQSNGIWEGDRLSLNFEDPGAAIENLDEKQDCILWVDGVQGVVRAMDLIPASTGQEAIVRTLLQAMEHPLDTPNQMSRPARPKKIVVRSRELQFFLRGVLQDLDITVEYQPELPLIDEFFSGMQRMITSRTSVVPAEYSEALDKAAQGLWKLTPWKQLSEHQVISLSLSILEEQPFYVSILGQLGLEFGILFYRSLDSLRSFRQKIMHLVDDSQASKQAFLSQDCLYVTFNLPEDLDDLPSPPISLDWEDVEVEFGSIHPLEGIQIRLGEEEAQLLLIAMESFKQFFQKHQKTLKKGFPELSNTFQLSFEGIFPEDLAHVSVQVDTHPQVSEELVQVEQDYFDDDDDDYFDEDDDDDEELLGGAGMIPLRGDLVPEKSIVSLESIPWKTYEILKDTARTIPASTPPKEAEILPVVIIQTSRPKAKAMTEQIKKSGGLTGLCFAPGTDRWSGLEFELGILQLGNGENQVFEEYMLDEDDDESEVYAEAREQWHERSIETENICGVLICQGVTGKNRGKSPDLKDIVILIEAPLMDPEDLLEKPD
jgi:hypothetical protein